MTLRLRTTTAAAALAVVLGVSACSSDDPESAPSGPVTSPAASESTTSGSAISESAATQSGATSAAEESAPAGSATAVTESPQQSAAPTVESFPKPPDMKVAQSGSIGTAGFALAGTVADPKAAYDFWLVELPKAGWTVGQHSFIGQGTTAIGSIEFSSADFGASTVGIFGTRVAIAVQN